MTGVLGLIGDAARQGLVDFDDAVNQLKSLDFRISDAVIDAVRKRLS